MDKPISVGDLVQVVKPMVCGCTKSIGWMYRVVDIAPPTPFVERCKFCFAPARHGCLIAYREDGAGAEINRLKRIPPPEELNIVKEDEEITA